LTHNIHEEIEHAAHGDHDHGPQSSLPRWIGITIAMLGVLMALCSAQLGAARTELISTMVEENAAKAQFMAVSNKYRMLQAQLQHLHAAMPDVEFMKKKNEEFKTLESATKNPETKQGLLASKLTSDKILNSVIPTPGDVERFLDLIDRTREDNEAAKKWSDSFHDAVALHKDSAEHFEYALVTAEIAIVIASVGLLLAKQLVFARGAFTIAVILGATSLTIAGGTFINNKRALHATEEKIEASHHHFMEKNKDKEDVEQDMKLEKEMRKDLPELEKLMKAL
jgi:Domain of unknown function (DUF4337)